MAPFNLVKIKDKCKIDNSRYKYNNLYLGRFVEDPLKMVLDTMKELE